MASKFSGIIQITDLDDFIGPGQVIKKKFFFFFKDYYLQYF